MRFTLKLVFSSVLAIGSATYLSSCSSSAEKSAETTTSANVAVPGTASEKTLTGQPPIIIGHRGASGEMPEETLESYKLAIERGADFIEPDLVPTKDGVLIARHENNLTETTNVSVIFPKMKKTKTIDGKSVEGFFSEDFTFAQIQKLRARERVPQRNQSNNDKFKIIRLEDVLDLAKKESKRLGRPIGVYIETKHPTYFQKIGLPLEDRLLKILKTYGYGKKTDPIFLQSFEIANLKYLRSKTQLRLVQLYDEGKESPFDTVAAGKSKTYSEMMTNEGLAEVATYADGIGPWKDLIIPQTASKELTAPTDLIARAHKAGLLVHAYTFRNDKPLLAKNYQDDPIKEFQTFFNLGIDGVFTDYPGTGVQARQEWIQTLK